MSEVVPSDLSFLSRIVAVNFGGGPTDYVVLTIDATTLTFANQGPPTAPQVGLVPPPGATVTVITPDVIQHTQVNPAGSVPVIFLWFAGAPFPSAATFNIPVIGGQGIGGVSYGGQFNYGYNFDRTSEAEENVINGNPDAPTTLPPLDLSSLDTAATCAAVFNALPENQRTDTTYFTSSPPLTATVPGNLAVFAAELFVPTPATRQSSTELKEQILIALPRLATGKQVQGTINITLLGGSDPASPQVITAALYLGVKTKNPSIAQVQASGPAAAKASISGASSATSGQIQFAQSSFSTTLKVGRSPAVLHLA